MRGDTSSSQTGSGENTARPSFQRTRRVLPSPTMGPEILHTPCLSCPETWRTAKPWTTNSPGCNFSLFTVSLSVTCFLTWLLMPVAMSPTLTRWNSRICRCSPLRDWIWTLTPRKPRLRVRESEGREEAGYSEVGVGRREAGRAKGNLCEVTRGVEQVWLGQSSREQIQGPEYYTALPG